MYSISNFQRLPLRRCKNLYDFTNKFSRRCGQAWTSQINKLKKQTPVYEMGVIYKRDFTSNIESRCFAGFWCCPSLLKVPLNFTAISTNLGLYRTYQNLRSERFSLKNPVLQKHLKKALQEYEDLTVKLLERDAVSDKERMGLGKIHWKLTPLAESSKEYENKKMELLELEKMLGCKCSSQQY
jgi:hypothetical protein